MFTRMKHFMVLASACFFLSGVMHGRAENCLPYSHFPPTIPTPYVSTITGIWDVNDDGFRDILLSSGPSVLHGDAAGGFTYSAVIDSTLSGTQTGFFGHANLDDVADVFTIWKNQSYDAFFLSYVSNSAGELELRRIEFLGTQDEFQGAAVANYTTYNSPMLVNLEGQADGTTLLYLRRINSQGTLFSSQPVVLPYLAYDPILCDLNGDSINDMLLHDGEYITRTFLGPLSSQQISEDAVINQVPTGYHPDPKDFDDDGIPELVLQIGNSLVVYRRNDTGYSQWLGANLVGFFSYIGAGDYDNDGDVDLFIDRDACMNAAMSCCMTVLENVNNQGFSVGTNISTGCEPRQVTVDDMDSNGLNDIVVVNDYSIVILYADGLGGLLNSVAVHSNPSSVNYTEDVVAADLNNDQRDDLLYFRAQTLNGLSVLMNHGDGNFAAPIAILTGSTMEDLRVADMNEDGTIDIVCATGNASTGVKVGIGTGNGQFSLMTNSMPGQPADAAVGDVNGDGHLDIAAVCWSIDTLSILLGNGDGTFEANQNYSTPDQPVGVDIADLNGDGLGDVVTSNVGSANNIAVFLASEGGMLSPPQTLSVWSFNARLENVQLADIDLDDAVDIVAPAGGVGVWFGDGDGTFGQLQILAGNSDTHRVEIADINRDGLSEILWTDFESGVGILSNMGNRQFQNWQGLAAPAVSHDTAAGDFDGVGDLDIALAHRLGTSIFFSNNCEIESAVTGDANGDGVLAVDDISIFVSILLENHGSLAARKATDMNGDGHNDGQDVQQFAHCLINGGC